MKCCNCDREATKTIVFKDGWKEKSFDLCTLCHVAWNWGWAVRDDGCVIVDDGCGEDYFAADVGKEDDKEVQKIMDEYGEYLEEEDKDDGS